MENKATQSKPVKKKHHQKKTHRLKILLPYDTQSQIVEKNKGCIIPATRNTQAKEPTHKAELKQRGPKPKKLKKKLQREILLTLCHFPECVENCEAAAKLFLLVLMIQVFQLMVGVLPTLPILVLSGFAKPACTVISSLLNAIQGPNRWVGKDWYLNRPWVINPRCSLGETSLSTSIMDYLGGKFKDWDGKKRKFYFPFIDASVLLMPGLPAALTKQIINLSPLTLPIVFEPWKPDGVRSVLKLDNSPFDSYDMDAIEKLNCSAQYCHMQIISFLCWFCDKGKRFDHWREDIGRLRPVIRNGRFSQPQSDDWTEFLCAGLSFFKQFLHYASEKARWITVEEAQEILLRYWRWVLPNSAPMDETQDGDGTQDALTLCYDDPQVYYQFLTEYFLPTYKNQVLCGKKGEPGTMAVIRKLDEENWFIAPRNQFLETYASWLSERNAPIFEPGKEAAVQHRLLETGVPLRGEKNNPATWRYSFYEGSKDKVDCLALPIAKLPEWVQKVFGIVIGTPADAASHPTPSERVPNGLEGVEVP